MRWVPSVSASPDPVVTDHLVAGHLRAGPMITPTRPRPRPFAHSGCNHRARDIASKGIYPAVDPLSSTSWRILDPRYVAVSLRLRQPRQKAILQRNKEPQDIIALIGIDELGEEDKTTVNRARKIEQFLGQNFWRGLEKFTGRPGSYVRGRRDHRSLHPHLRRRNDDVPEQASSGTAASTQIPEEKCNNMQKELGA